MLPELACRGVLKLTETFLVSRHVQIRRASRSSDGVGEELSWIQQVHEHGKLPRIMGEFIVSRPISCTSSPVVYFYMLLHVFARCATSLLAPE